MTHHLGNNYLDYCQDHHYLQLRNIIKQLQNPPPQLCVQPHHVLYYTHCPKNRIYCIRGMTSLELSLGNGKKLHRSYIIHLTRAFINSSIAKDSTRIIELVNINGAVID